MDPLRERERDERRRLAVQHAPALNPDSKALLTTLRIFFVSFLTLLKVEQPKPFYLSKPNTLACL